MRGRQLAWSAGLAGVLAATAAGGAVADTISAQTRSGNFNFNSQQGQQTNVPLAPGVNASPTFAYIQGDRLMVSYTAECAVAGNNNTTFLDLDIQVRNITDNTVTVLPPTAGNSDAFCTANGTQALDGWQMNAVNAVMPSNLPSGLYQVQVRARLNGAGRAGLGDSSLVIWK